MTKTAKVKGHKIEVDNIDFKIPETLQQNFKLKSYIEVSTTRSENKEQTVELEENDLIALQFSDNTEWIGHPEDVQDIYDKKTQSQRALAEEDYIFNIHITSENNRGFINRAIVKVFSVFTPDKVNKLKEKTLLALAEAYDKKIQPKIGLFQLDKNFNKIKFNQKEVDTKTHLLFIHGTLSTTFDAFQKLNSNNGAWQNLVELYGDRIWALEHHTLSVSPLQNALDFLNDCPKNCTIDIISHSRGGLVADILAKCDYRNQVTGFHDSEIAILKTPEEKTNRELMAEINRLAKTKKLKVNKVVRVAAPASGTTILSRRTDHYFNLILNAASMAFGITNPFYHSLKAFLLDIISHKDNPEVLPGLNSMMPESLFQKMMNISATTVESELYTIAGDSDISGLNLHSLKVILANLFYQGANDLVVDTNRMMHGVTRTNGMYKFLAKGGNTSHFNYFSANNSSNAVIDALKASSDNPSSLFTKSLYTQGNRGVLLNTFSMDGVSYKVKDITKDVVIVIPGIMGSSLSQNNEHQWVNMKKIFDGGIVDNLKINKPKVKANGVIKDFYNDFAEHLQNEYDVITFEFDWRKSLTEAAKNLKKELEEVLKTKNIKTHIVAHSMGGLVVRQLIMDFPEVWGNFKLNTFNKFVMLGTPWLGSYLIMEVLTGHSRRVKQLAAIDIKNDRADLLKIFWKYPGVFELLPIEESENRPFWDPKFWKNLNDITDLKHMPNPDDFKEELAHFKAYREKIIAFTNNLQPKDLNNVYYVCGLAKETVFDYKFKNRFLSKNKKLVYEATSHGDGSVTWETGIPKQLLNSQKIFYSHTSHGDLANETYIFKGVSEILNTGSTNLLSNDRSGMRSGEIITEVYETPEPIYNEAAVLSGIFDIKKEVEPEVDSFNVRVVHADLKVAFYPVMVGHFFMDLILSSEKALDKYLDDRLSQRMNIGYYPGKIGESEVFFNLKTQPKGAIVCGLGNADTVTPFLLSKSVKQAVLKYAMFMRDNYTLPEAKEYATGISFVLMAIGYGKLPVEDSVKGILLGVAKANKQIKETGEGLKQIKDIEFINYYESVSSEAYLSLYRLQESDNRVAFNLQPNIVRRAGAKKRNQFRNNDYNWWYNLHIGSIIDTTKSSKINGFKYFSSNKLARVDEEKIGIKLSKILYLLEEMSTTYVWDERLSKTLFEMLIPNDFKNIFRDQNNVILKLDKYAAQIPWELLFDSTTTDKPASVNTGFIRQLITQDGSPNTPVSLNNHDVFVVGDPIYNTPGLLPLPAAKEEAIWVIYKFKKEAYRVNPLINSNAKHIMMELFSKPYKIMHFAGHGVYNPEDENVGIAIGNGLCIDPAVINQIGYVPEFIFINCCFSGVLDAEDDSYSKNRFKLAANIGTQLIEMGVKAIIITGWPVDDAAARTFAETFYKKMFEGYNFGDAVQKARMACHNNHSGSNTWGAYQCYGNQYYKFRNSSKSKKNNQKYIIASQAYTDLDNLLIAVRDKNVTNDAAIDKLNDILDKTQESNLIDATVLEKEALIYDELGHSDLAYEKYKELFVFDNGNFSIKALEQYCLVQSVILKNKIVDLNLKKGDSKISAYINEYISEIKLLTLAGRNTTRLNIVANAYKQTAPYFDKTEELQHLFEAYKLYEQALNISKDKYDGKYLDAFSNMVFIAYCLEHRKGTNTFKDALINSQLFPENSDFETLKTEFTLMDLLSQNRAFSKIASLDKFLEEYYQRLDDFDKADVDISVLFGMTEISYARLMLSNNNKAQLDQIILKWYKEIFNLLYSPRYIKVEIEQINFLLNYTKSEQVKASLEFILEELNKKIK
ncbi:hypothetical protein PK35_14990 [Tamlana nanhaiensis]|uniref:Uncharacterized protein n=1 Tax=Neotamlana nanhaiensis TaxID=1382798 RepID=A0A0D7W0Q1_9FLAO|nr:CHAT domain-containing protein [Tamlana nanhaiensis]KJD31412.1 hypothetical protein PK35_14990 [Tamlana nanhaiensis]